MRVPGLPDLTSLLTPARYRVMVTVDPKREDRRELAHPLCPSVADATEQYEVFEVHNIIKR
jgi:hypothetical protein